MTRGLKLTNDMMNGIFRAGLMIGMGHHAMAFMNNSESILVRVINVSCCNK